MRKHPITTTYVIWTALVVAAAYLIGGWVTLAAGLIPAYGMPAVTWAFYAFIEGPRFVWEAMLDGWRA